MNEWISKTEAVDAALAARIGHDAAEAVTDRMFRYTNTPNTITGVGKWASDPVLEAAALSMFRDPELAAVLELDDPDARRGRHLSATAWGLLTLAARPDIGVLDTLPAEVREESERNLRAITRAAKKHAGGS